MPIFSRTPKQSLWPLDMQVMARGLRAIADGLDAGDDEAIALVDDADLHPETILVYLSRHAI
ncbi:hypothetical protein ACFY7H_13095 [Streptomyces sp. NPDC012794]|uniref:hypothetical protein n=1 Tax=Streptomyces sp. NPDC012794 TaxID=3364850 RepID=UPI0036A8EBDC